MAAVRHFGFLTRLFGPPTTSIYSVSCLWHTYLLNEYVITLLSINSCLQLLHLAVIYYLSVPLLSQKTQNLL